MAAALRASIDRRDGSDADTLVYLTVLERERALGLLDLYRTRRFRYFDWHAGDEFERLTWMAQEIRAGRSVEELNRPPDDIALYPIMPLDRLNH